MSNAKVESLENNKVKVIMTISNERFEEGMVYSYNKNKGKINIPGFRKGKAPRKMIEMQYGKEFLYDDAINFVLQDAYTEALDEFNLDVVSRPTISEPNFTEDGLVIEAEVYVKPDVTVDNYVGVEIEKVETEVTEEDIMAEIQKELDKNSRLVNVSDRPIENGDIANIDFEGFVDGVPFEGGKSQGGYDLEIGSHSFIDTFEDQLIGKKVGEECEVNVTFPENYGNEELKGAKALFKVKVNDISKKELPEVDDDFASEVSEFDTLDEYKKDIKAKLSETKLANAERIKENRVIEAVVEKAVMDIPQPMIDTRVDQMVTDFSNQIKQQGMDLEMYLGYVGQTMETLRAAYQEDAKKQVSARLVLEAIGVKEDFEITDADIKGELERIAEAYKMEVEQLEAVIRPEDREGIIGDLKTQKALKLIVESAVEV